MARGLWLDRALLLPLAAFGLAGLEPPARAAVIDFDFAVGVPRIALTSTGAELTRGLMATAENALLRIDASSTVCAQTLAGQAPVFAGRATCATAEKGGPAAGIASQSGGLALKLPQLPALATRVELSLVSWRSGVGREASRGTDAEVQVIQSWRTIDLAFGHSEPTGLGADGAWRSTWVAAGVQVFPRLRLQLASERSREVVTEARDARVTAAVSYAVQEGMRARLHVTRIADDSVRPWLAGLGLACTF